MNKWLKRYLILTICFILVFLPLISIFNAFDIFSSPTSQLIFWIVFGIIVLAYYIVMTIVMINGDKKNKEK